MDLFLKRLFFKDFCEERTSLQSLLDYSSSAVVGGIVSISTAVNPKSSQKFDLHKWLLLNKWSTQRASLFGCEMFLFRVFHFNNLLFSRINYSFCRNCPYIFSHRRRFCVLAWVCICKFWQNVYSLIYKFIEAVWSSALICCHSADT